MLNRNEIAVLIGILCGLWGVFRFTPIQETVDAILAVSPEDVPAAGWSGAGQEM